MGWKSTVHISRSRAIELVNKRLLSANNEELSDIVEDIGYGDNQDLEYFGNNFIIDDTEGEREEYERLKRKFGE